MLTETNESTAQFRAMVRKHPQHWLGALVSFQYYVMDVDRILHLSIQGIVGMQATADLREAFEDAKRKFPHLAPGNPATAEEIAETRELQNMAVEETTKGFPLLYAHSTVAVWSALEAAFPKFVVNWLAKFPETLKRPELEKIKIPLAQYYMMTDEARLEFAVDQLFQAVQYSKKPGVGRYEAVLESLGISGPVDDDVRRDLYEMSQVRNLVVHQFSIVDGRFAATCPWFKLKVGDHLCIDAKSYDRYRKAAWRYVGILIHRMLDLDPTVAADLAMMKEREASAKGLRTSSDQTTG